jgi:hypothetical protein
VTAQRIKYLKDAAMRERLEIVRAPKVKHGVYLLPRDMRHLLKRLLMSTASLLQQKQKHFKEKICTHGSQERMQKTSSSSDSTKDYFLKEQKQRCKKSRKSGRLQKSETACTCWLATCDICRQVC